MPFVSLSPLKDTSLLFGDCFIRIVVEVVSFAEAVMPTPPTQFAGRLVPVSNYLVTLFKTMVVSDWIGILPKKLCGGVFGKTMAAGLALASLVKGRPGCCKDLSWPISSGKLAAGRSKRP
jgi:hypothetical protein